jgi:hypothetical protein
MRIVLSAVVIALVGCAPGGADGTGGAGGGEILTGAGGDGDGDGVGSGGDASGSGGASSTSSATTSTSTSSGAGAGGPDCPPPPLCDAPFPDFGPERDFEHTSSDFFASTGSPNHRGRDMFYNPGDAVWVMGKFTYGITDKDLKDEEVDVWLLRGCGDTWEKLATVRTTEEDEHPTTEGVDDSGGWVFYQLPQELALEPGRHRFELVVGGDLSHTSVFVDVVTPQTPLVVTDVDGTLTTSETEEFGALLTGDLPDANADSAAVLHALVGKGYRVFYLTARPEFLGQRTRDFLDQHGYPPGLVHTTLNTTGALGSAAHDFKLGELQAIGARGLMPAWAFGNTDSDASAFFEAGIQPNEHRVFFQYDDSAHGSRTIQAYAELLGEIDALPPVCE